jgi:carboxylate-amine ligase
MTLTHPQRLGTRPAGRPPRLSLGVEEEFLLLDPKSGVNLPVGEAVIGALPDGVRGQSRAEFRRSMVEMVTPVCSDLDEVGEQLTMLRWAAAVAATQAGARLVAVGATPVADPHRDVPAGSRYAAMARQYGAIAHDPAVCGCHIHVGVPDRALAIDVCSRLRIWLPMIQAIAANSPLHAGSDTGHASWRSVQLERWPSLGPTPEFDCPEDYDRTVNSLVASGVMLDPTMVYWYARPSVSYPTVEVRVADVCPTVADTVLVAGLVRGLVATMLEHARAGEPLPHVADCLVSAAHWRAAHDGLDGNLVDLRTNQIRPAWDLVDDMVETILPALEWHGDVDLVTDQLASLRRAGNGATRQRHILRRTGSIRAVLDGLTDHTLYPWTAGPTADKWVARETLTKATGARRDATVNVAAPGHTPDLRPPEGIR